MNLFLALDCGGTKVAAVLYDENMRRRAACVAGSVRPNTTSDDLIRQHTEDLINGLGLAGLEVEEYGGVCEPRLIETIRSVCRLGKAALSGETETGLAAAGIFGDGLLALCGTGATMFARVAGKTCVAGGYGAAVADEGSGYYVGRAGLIAAIRDSEDRGEHTALTDMLPSHFGFEGPEEIRPAIFSIYGRTDRSPAASVAGFAPVVVRAARQGDAVAAAILEDAGRLLGLQMAHLIKKNSLPGSLPLAISGSMWRGNPVMLNAFRDTLRERGCRGGIVIPRLEPVLGVLARRIYETRGAFTEEDVTFLLSEYPEFGFEM